jgi:hypothetical protein
MSNGNRTAWRILAGAGALALAGGAAGAPAYPHPGGGKKIERIVIIRDGAGHADGVGRRIRRVEVDGGDLVDCAAGDKVVDESGGGDEHKTKVVLCSQGGDSAHSAGRLEEALARIEANDDLGTDQKARIEAALRSAIDRARSAR